MGVWKRVCTTALGSTLLAGTVIHSVTDPLYFDKPSHTDIEITYQHVNTTGTVVVLGSGTVITPGSGTLVIEGDRPEVGMS